MPVQWLVWIGKLQCLGPSQNARIVKAATEKHEFNVCPDIDDIEGQCTTASGRQVTFIWAVCFLASLSLALAA
uniref:Purple acid phosphatase n=1 Tax=Rhizophora mucronata TaxID=61149 RepID=A0A2P2Q5J1_RHIMU